MRPFHSASALETEAPLNIADCLKQIEAINARQSAIEKKVKSLPFALSSLLGSKHDAKKSLAQYSKARDAFKKTITDPTLFDIVKFAWNMGDTKERRASQTASESLRSSVRSMMNAKREVKAIIEEDVSFSSKNFENGIVEAEAMLIRFQEEYVSNKAKIDELKIRFVTSDGQTFVPEFQKDRPDEWGEISAELVEPVSSDLSTSEVRNTVSLISRTSGLNKNSPFIRAECLQNANLENTVETEALLHKLKSVGKPKIGDLAELGKCLRFSDSQSSVARDLYHLHEHLESGLASLIEAESLKVFEGSEVIQENEAALESTRLQLQDVSDKIDAIGEATTANETRTLIALSEERERISQTIEWLKGKLARNTNKKMRGHTRIDLLRRIATNEGGIITRLSEMTEREAGRIFGAHPNRWEMESAHADEIYDKALELLVPMVKSLVTANTMANPEKKGNWLVRDAAGYDMGLAREHVKKGGTALTLKFSVRWYFRTLYWYEQNYSSDLSKFQNQIDWAATNLPNIPWQLLISKNGRILEADFFNAPRDDDRFFESEIWMPVPKEVDIENLGHALAEYERVAKDERHDERCHSSVHIHWNLDWSGTAS